MFWNNQQQTIWSWSTGYQADRDIIIHEDWINNLSFPIIAEIFEHIFSEIEGNWLEEEEIIDLKKKVDLNFNGQAKLDFIEVYKESRGMMNDIQRYMKECNQGKIQSLILKTRSLFKEYKEVDSHRAAIENIDIFVRLAEFFVPKDGNGNTKNGSYLAHTQAIIILIFEMCEFGLLTEEEIQIRLLM